MGASGLVVIIGFWYIYYYFYILIGGDVCLGFWLGLISDWSGLDLFGLCCCYIHLTLFMPDTDLT